MTLVVALKSDEEIRIFSDTKITNPQKPLKGMENSTLKAVILNHNVCVCYAGNVGRGHSAIQKLYSQIELNFDLEEVLAFLQKQNVEGEGDTDFILASLTPKPSLYKIQNGIIDREVQTAWIGEKEGFSTLQMYRSKVPPLPFANENPSPAKMADDIWKTKKAMERIIEGTIHKGISEFLIEVGTGNNGFYYEKNSLSFPPTLKPNQDIFDNYREVAAASGSFTYTILTPSESGVGAVGIHIYQGNFGALLYPKYNVNPIVFRNVNELEFKEKVCTEFNITLEDILDE